MIELIMLSIVSVKHMTKIENPAMMMLIVVIVLIYDYMRGMMFIAMLIGSSGFIKSILVMVFFCNIMRKRHV